MPRSAAHDPPRLGNLTEEQPGLVARWEHAARKLRVAAGPGKVPGKNGDYSGRYRPQWQLKAPPYRSIVCQQRHIISPPKWRYPIGRNTAGRNKQSPTSVLFYFVAEPGAIDFGRLSLVLPRVAPL